MNRQETEELDELLVELQKEWTCWDYSHDRA